MAFNMTTSGDGWRLAGSLIQLGHEVAALDSEFTCLGTIGDASHAAQGTASDHNPWVKDAHGVGVVRAIDIGGPDAKLKALRQIIWGRYAASDPRIFPAGYAKGCSDNLINNEGLPFGTHEDDGDAGHLHISVGLTGYDSTASWNLGATFSGGGTLLEAGMDEQSIASAIAQWKVPIDQGGQPLFWVWATSYALLEQIRDAVTALKAAQPPAVDVTALAGQIIKQLAAK